MDSKACGLCVKEIEQITNFEKEINKSSVFFYQTVNKIDKKELVSASLLENEENGLKCIEEVQTQWIRIKKLHSCAEIHLESVAKYHQFNHEVKKLRTEMYKMINQAEKSIPLNLAYIGDEQYINTIDESLKELVFSYRYWVCKLNKMAENSKNIVNPQERFEKLQDPKPITALCDFRTESYDVKLNEDLILIDNEDPLMWKVTNMEKTHEFYIPSVVCYIAPPHSKMIGMAQQLLLEYLKAWTINIKRLGKNLILYMIYIVWNFTEDELEKMSYLSKDEKNMIVSILNNILKELLPIWGGFKGYQILCEQVESFKTSLQLESSKRNKSLSSGTIDIRFEKLRNIMEKFTSLWKYWSSFHSVVSFSLESHYLLAVNMLRDLEIIRSDNLKTKWQNELEFENEDESYTENWMTILKQKFTKVKCTHEQKQEKLEAEELMRSEQEEKKVFTITGVHNPRTGQDVSMQQAVSLGIIDQNNGLYVNRVNMTSIPIPEAMNQGLIKVEVTIVKKTKEKKSDMGLVTVQTKLESRPYNVVAVVDAITGLRLNIDEALEKGIIDLDNGIYINRKTRRDMTLSAALQAKLLEVEFDNETKLKQPELVSQVYAVHTVKDQMRQEEVGFSVAIKRGILDQNTGSYYNNVTKESIYITKAIQHGFINAVKVDKNSDI